MLTRIAPILAVPYWSSTHSAQFGAQMPTRSPASMPAATRPSATASVSASSPAYVHQGLAGGMGSRHAPQVGTDRLAEQGSGRRSVAVRRLGRAGHDVILRSR